MSEAFNPNLTLGILGGGQLGKMLLPEAMKLGIKVAVLDPHPEAPCTRWLGDARKGSLMDYDTVMEFGRSVDLVTIEIENVNADALSDLEQEGKRVYPQAHVVKTIQNKAVQKQFYQDHDIPTLPFRRFESVAELDPEQLTYPCVHKTATMGYDGQGVNIIRTREDFAKIPDVPGIIEEYLGEKVEISVLVARNPSGEMQTFPISEMEFHPEANLVEFLYCPASVSGKVWIEAPKVAEKVAEAFGLVGIMAVEMFVTHNDEVMVNESAPRPHNSGHHTIESNYTSQYEQHIKAILDLPLGPTTIKSPAVMVNLLGEEGHKGLAVYEGLEEIMKMEGVYVHVYGKAETRPFRKMGHATIIAPILPEARIKAMKVKETIKVKAQ